MSEEEGQGTTNDEERLDSPIQANGRRRRRTILLTGIGLIGAIALIVGLTFLIRTQHKVCMDGSCLLPD